MNSYQSSFNRLFSTGPYQNLSGLSDSSLLTEDGFTFEVHRFVLARENSYFQALFCGIGHNRRDFLLPGIRGDILDLVLTYIYQGTADLTQSNACELLEASDYLLLNGLASKIKEFVDSIMSLDNCVLFYTTAMTINHQDIVRSSCRFIQTHFEALRDSNLAKFGAMSFDLIKDLLGDQNLCVRSEHEVWLSIVKWVEYDVDNRLCHIPDLIQCLMVSDMDERLAMDILFSDIITNNPFCKGLDEIMCEPISCFHMLLKYRLKISPSPLDFHIQRRPERIHLIARPFVQGLTHSVQLYLTYDEYLDWWRKLGETDFHPTYLVAIGYDVYMFDADRNRGIIFDLIDEQWQNIDEIPRHRVSYCLVTLRNKLCVLGGQIERGGEDLLDVQFYDPDNNEWFQASPMLPVFSYSAATFQDTIFVVGMHPDEDHEFEMRVQVYNEESDSWMEYPSPNVSRFDFALAVFDGKLFIIGGSNGLRLLESVETFDLDRNMWEAGTDLPHAYFLPKVILLNDILVVYDDHRKDPNIFRKKPPIVWNEFEASWEPLDKFPPLKDLEQYLICTITNDAERLTWIWSENRNPATQFEKSPFKI